MPSKNAKYYKGFLGCDHEEVVCGFHIGSLNGIRKVSKGQIATKLPWVKE